MAPCSTAIRYCYHRAMLIPHARPLLKGTLVARYDRFIARIRLPDREVDAHCVNTGRMEGLVKPGATAWVSQVPPDSKRKLRYTLELLNADGVVTGANTQLPNTLAEILVRQRLIPGLRQYSRLQREVRYGDRSRIDMLLEWGQRKHFVEVKNCHLVYPDGGAYFPDSVSERATGHLRELTKQVHQGDKATVLFVVQRNDVQKVLPSDLHDPVFAAAAREAYREGVKFRAIAFDVSEAGFRFIGTRPVSMRAYSAAALEDYRDAWSPYSGWVRRPRGA